MCFSTGGEAINSEIAKTIEELSHTAQSVSGGHGQANLTALLDSIKKVTSFTPFFPFPFYTC